MDSRHLIITPVNDPLAERANDAPDVVHKTSHRDRAAGNPGDHPTVQAYQPLIDAFDHFNREHFGGELPACIITLQREQERVLGYYHANRFGHRERPGVTTDEIAMNPRHFQTRSLEETLSTLVHEMVHLWQHHDPKGNPSRTGYHNKTWSEKMQDIGLRPTHDGTPNGRLHGQKMTQIIVSGGPFDVACKNLISQEFRLAWYDRLHEMTRVVSGNGSDTPPAPTTSAGKRTKFTCPKCDANAWGKPTLKVICGDCQEGMTSAA